MANLREVVKAINVLKSNGASKIIVLHCVSNYPCSLDSLNLNIIPEIQKRYNCCVGYSDHSVGSDAAILSFGQGARVIEKHFTTNKNLRGPDHKASLDPDEFAKYVKNIRDTEIMLGSEIKEVTKSEKKNIVTARKSLVLSCDVKKDDKITIDNLVVKRPGNGIQPADFYKIIGKKINKSLRANHMLKKTDIK